MSNLKPCDWSVWSHCNFLCKYITFCRLKLWFAEFGVCAPCEWFADYWPIPYMYYTDELSNPNGTSTPYFIMILDELWILSYFISCEKWYFWVFIVGGSLSPSKLQRRLNTINNGRFLSCSWFNNRYETLTNELESLMLKIISLYMCSDTFLHDWWQERCSSHRQQALLQNHVFRRLQIIPTQRSIDSCSMLFLLIFLLLMVLYRLVVLFCFWLEPSPIQEKMCMSCTAEEAPILQDNIRPA